MFKKSDQQQLLSYHYSNYKKSLKNNKLNLFGKAITAIDILPLEEDITSTILQVDLSHNGLYQIDNISQFSNAEFINLSHNRIISDEEVLKLQKMSKLHTLYLKGNPFLRSKMSKKTIAFLLSLTTDIEIVSSEVQKLIQSYATKILQNEAYEHYLKKLEIYIQMLNNYQVDNTFVNTSYAMFPKIKKIFQQLFKQIFIKRQLIEKIQTKYFQNQIILIDYLSSKLQDVESRRSNIIKRIYEREEVLRNVRSTYNMRVVPKRTIPRIMNSSVSSNGYFSPPKLKESIKQSKFIPNSIARLSRKKYEDQQNSPSRVTQSQSLIQSEQTFINLLIKLNPLYHLLHSPLQSLKSHEKQLLIQNLCLHLRQKMKEVFKYEKKQQYYSKIDRQYEDLQQYLKQMSGDVKKQQEKASQKLKKMSNICQQQSQRVQNLCQQLQKYQEQVKILRLENCKLKQSNQQLLKSIKKFQQQDKIQYVIRQKMQNGLLCKYIKLMRHKGYHMSQLKMMHQINNKVYLKQLKQISFQSFKINKQLSYKFKIINNLIIQKNYRSFIKQVRTSIHISSFYRQLLSYLFNHHKKQFCRKFRQTYLKSKIITQKINKFKQIKNKKIKRNIFSFWKELLEQKDNQQIWQFINYQSNILRMRKFIRSWKNYITNYYKIQQNKISQIISLKKSNVFQIFISNCRKQLMFNSSTIATTQFLPKIRKFNNYLKFTKIISSILLDRSIKAKKIEIIRKHLYIECFISTIRDCQLRKKILVERQIQLRRKQEEVKLLQKNKKQLKVTQLKRYIFVMNNKIILKIINRQKTQYLLQKHNLDRSLKKLLNNLRSNWIYRFKLNYKICMLTKSTIIINRYKYFFKKINLFRIQLFKQKLRLNYNKILKYFYRWKLYIQQQRMEIYKQKFMQLGPQINQITQMQKSIQKQKQLLKLQVQQKDMMIEEYKKKCQQYQYILHSKDVKYQKLKDIYAEAMYKQDMNTTIKLNVKDSIKDNIKDRMNDNIKDNMKERMKDNIKQDEIYIKYLPLGMRNKYNLKNKNEQSYIRLLQDNKQLSLNKERNKNSFLSSFKRF